MRLPRWARWAAGWWLLLVASLTGFATFPVLLGYRPVVVVSGSMQPAVKPGDVAVVQPVGSGALGAVPGPIRVGDVVLVHDPAGPGQLLLHRVVEVRAGGALITRGDANTAADSTPVPATDVVGRVRFVVPAARRPAMIVHRSRPVDLAWTALIGLAVGVLALAGRGYVRPALGPVR